MNNTRRPSNKKGLFFEWGVTCFIRLDSARLDCLHHATKETNRESISFDAHDDDDDDDDLE